MSDCRTESEIPNTGPVAGVAMPDSSGTPSLSDSPVSTVSSGSAVDGNWRVRRVPAHGLVFDLAEQGEPDGRPVLLLHGFPQIHRAWDALAARLTAADAPSLRLLAPDQRGYSPGARPQEPAAYTLPVLAGDMLALLDAAGVEHADVVGHDWGALVGWYLAAHHPDRVRTLTAVSVPHPAALASALAESGEQRRMSEYVGLFRDPEKACRVLLEQDAMRLRRLYTPLPEAVAATHVDALRDPAALTAALRWYQAAKFGEGAGVPPVEVPVVFVWSSGDAAISRTAAERCVEHVAGAYRFVRLDAVSHWVPDEAPAELAAALPFLG